MGREWGGNGERFDGRIDGQYDSNANTSDRWKTLQLVAACSQFVSRLAGSNHVLATATDSGLEPCTGSPTTSEVTELNLTRDE